MLFFSNRYQSETSVVENKFMKALLGEKIMRRSCLYLPSYIRIEAMAPYNEYGLSLLN